MYFAALPYEVVVDGLGNADETNGAPVLVSPSAELVDRVHGVVAANVEHGAHARRLELGEGVLIERGVLVGLGQLEAATAQKACGRATQQLHVHGVAERAVEVQDAAGEIPLDSVAHAQHVRP